MWGRGVFSFFGSVTLGTLRFLFPKVLYEPLQRFLASDPPFRAAISLDLAGNIVVDKSQQENQPGTRDRSPFFLPLPKA